MMNRKTIAASCVTLTILIGVSGCAEKTLPEPKNYKERVQAIENNPKFSPEQKEAYKKQAEEIEKASAMGRQMFGNAPKPSGVEAKSP